MSLTVLVFRKTYLYRHESERFIVWGQDHFEDRKEGFLLGFGEYFFACSKKRLNS